MGEQPWKQMLDVPVPETVFRTSFAGAGGDNRYQGLHEKRQYQLFEVMSGTEQEILGRSVIMRPYLRQFVEKYHTWMVRLHVASIAVSGVIILMQ